MLKIALVVPPNSDLNTLYSSIPRLAGWLRKLGHEVVALDISIEVFHRIFSRSGLERIFAAIDPQMVSADTHDVYVQRERYIRIIDDVSAFITGRDYGLAHRLARGNVIPSGPRSRLEPPQHVRRAFGEFGVGDDALHLIGFMLQDLADLFGQTVSPWYGLTKYAESIAYSLEKFDEIEDALRRPRNVIEEIMLEAIAAMVPEDVDIVGTTCPFPGNLFGALLVGGWVKQHRPSAWHVMGGGYPSTELRDLTDPRVFDYIDYLVIDDGEVPLQQLCARRAGSNAPLSKTFVREGDRVVYHDGSCETPRFGSLPAPDYRDIDFSRYVNLTYFRNHLSRMQTAGKWLKLTAAHGCYWKQCAFCDTTLPYIGDFDPMSARELADQMDAMYEQTKLSGFHFTDEAAPPSLLVGLSLELLRRGRGYRFWGNVRYDTYFTPERCRLLAAAGMIAVTGGIEVASDEVLPKIAKGITVPQTVKVLQAFSEAGILTHAYMMYGFPGETPQDTINSIEVVRQLAQHNFLQSGFYHQFQLTAHAPLAKKPELYGIRISSGRPAGFAHYVLRYESSHAIPQERVFAGLQNAIIAYAGRLHLERPVGSFFTTPMPLPTTSPTFVSDLLDAPHPGVQKGQPRLCWLGGRPLWHRGMLTVACERGEIYTTPVSRTVADQLVRCHPSAWESDKPPLLASFDDVTWHNDFKSRGMVVV